MKSHKTATFNKDGITHLVYHNTIIVKHNHLEQTIKLDTGGHLTKTTKARMNAYFNENNLKQFQIIQKNFAWYIRTPSPPINKGILGDSVAKMMWRYENTISYNDGLIFKTGV